MESDLSLCFQYFVVFAALAKTFKGQDIVKCMKRTALIPEIDSFHLFFTQAGRADLP